ncbi:MAG: DUF1972 domain-containing protein [Bacteroides sp.]|nr:DUF1972 domain-containing protein [Bacteroides sp.]
MLKRVSIIGTVGIPASYGGFETLVENLVIKNDNTHIEYTIYCSSKSYEYKLIEYKRAKLKYIPFKANGIQSIIYDICSLVHASFHSDKIIILGVSGCCFLPIFRFFSKKQLIINIDGLEHKRDKWNKRVKKFLLYSEKMAIKYGNIIISDNVGIQNYIRESYNQESVMIPYGGDHVLSENHSESNILEEYDLERNNYSFTVCRIEPENNVDLILDAFSRTKKIIVFVGNWKKGEYGINLLRKYKKHKNIKLLNPIYDIQILYTLRKNCKYYVHGHSAGGTNPSLVEAMFFGKPILAFNVIYNRETTENECYYFSTVQELVSLLDKKLSNGNKMLEIANRRYKWKDIVEQYEILLK